MCTIKKSSGLDFKTSFKDISEEGEIKVQISTVSKQMPQQILEDKYLQKRQLLLKKLDLKDNDKILLIDHFYPLAEKPDKKLTGDKKGKKCLDALLKEKEFSDIKIVIFTSVTTDKHMRKLLDEEGYSKIKDSEDEDSEDKGTDEYFKAMF